MESSKKGALILMVIIMLPALANVIMMSVWYSQINFQENESKWQFLYGICAASEAFALSMLSLCFVTFSRTLWYTFGFLHVVISFIANAVSGAVVSERAFHYNGFDDRFRSRSFLDSRCEAYNCTLLQTFSAFAFAISGLSVVTGILLYKSYKNRF